MDDSARRKPPARRSLEPRVSSVNSIISPRRRGPEGHNLAQILESLHHAQRETAGFATDERILRSYVHALERLFPTVRFAMRLSPLAADGTAIVQATTHHLRPDAMNEVSITEAGLVRGGFEAQGVAPVGMSVRRTYESILLAGPGEEPLPADGFDAPLSRAGEIIGVLCAEFDRGC